MLCIWPVCASRLCLDILFQPHIARPLTKVTTPHSCTFKFPVNLRVCGELTCNSSMLAELLLLPPLKLWLWWSPWALFLCSTSGYSHQDLRFGVSPCCFPAGEVQLGDLESSTQSITTRATTPGPWAGRRSTRWRREVLSYLLPDGSGACRQTAGLIYQCSKGRGPTGDER